MRSSSCSAAAGVAAALLWLTCAVGTSAAPIVVAGDGLTEETWGKTAKGTWLVEHYSPYCGHCRSFAPKWKELVDTYSTAADLHDFHFAQVDCASNGDLCHSHDVKYYPSIFLYVDGAFVEEFEERRTLENLGKFVEEHYPVGAEKLQGEKEAQEAEDKDDAAKDWDAKEAELDEQTGMGEAKAPGKARLPKEQDDGGVQVPKPAALHVTDDSTAPRDPDLDDQPFSELLADAEKNGENEVLYPSKPDSLPLTDATTTSTQTPPSSPTSTAKFAPPAFVAQQPSPRSEKEEKPVVADGTVQLLKAEDVAALKAPEGAPAFVKYFANWCTHCKALAPKWVDLASALSTSVAVYEMDCEAEGNKKVCRQEGVKAYPTLLFYNKGAVAEYHGNRNVEAMKQFALKAMSATTMKPVDTVADVKHAVAADEVAILFLHKPSASNEMLSLAKSAAQSLLGASAGFYTSSSALLLEHFPLPSNADAAFFTFKSHSLTPYSSFALPQPNTGFSPAYRLKLTKQYLGAAKLPLVSELNGATFADLMPSEADLVDVKHSPPPLVGLVVLSRKGLGDEAFEEKKRVVAEVAKGWNERRRMSGEGTEGRDVLWAWVDGDKWAAWLKSMYGVRMGAKDGPRVVVADPKDLSYYSSTLDGQPLELTSSAIYELIEQGIYTGKAEAQSSRNGIERFGHGVVIFLSSVYASALAHPILTGIAILASWYLLWKLLKKLFTLDDPRAGAGHQYAPVRGPKHE
ncbi:hypothetical protein JCM8097_001378 [Rhodosporidiobolus ruineniae]